MSSQSMSWKVGQGWGVDTRAIIEASRHDTGGHWTGNEVSRLLGMLSWITKSFDSMILKRGGEMYIYQ